MLQTEKNESPKGINLQSTNLWWKPVTVFGIISSMTSRHVGR